MGHLEIRDLWLQKEVRDGKLEVSKIPGTKPPADLMTKVLGLKDTNSRLEGMHIELKGSMNGDDHQVEGHISIQGVGAPPCPDLLVI
eukprot:8023674-Karenia_brevis.AAC.1